MTQECIICYTELSSRSEFKCCYNYKICNSIYCNDCYNRLVIMCLNENIVPKCTNTTCKLDIYYSEIKKNFNTDILKQYTLALIDHLLFSNKDDISELNIFNQIKIKLINEKKDFVKKFPTTIQLVIKISLYDKLQTVKKNNIKTKCAPTAKAKQIRCFNSICDGFLNQKNSNLTCVICEDTFCIYCHKFKKSMVHECNIEDINSVKLLQSMTKCPKCNIPVEKTYGCNNATCPNCKTNFCFVTGRLKSAGNHDDLTLNIKLNEYKLNELYKNDYEYDVLNKIKDIENNRPIYPDLIHKQLVNKIYKYRNAISCNTTCNINTESESKRLRALHDKHIIEINMLYEEYNIKKLMFQSYINKLKQIEKLHNEKQLNVVELDKIIYLYE